MNNINKNQRSVYWDNIKGILMLLTVFAHVLFQLQDKSRIINTTVDMIYMFHMPAFVFVSGYFGKSERSHSFESILKLVLLYFVFNSIMGFIYHFDSLLEPMYSFWYLVALIVWRLTAHHIAKFKEIRLILFVVALFIGFYSSVDNTFAAARIIGFYPYYMCGYLLSTEKATELINKKYFKRTVIGIAVAVAAAIISVVAYFYFKYSDLDFQMGAYSEASDSFGRIVLFIIAFLAIYALRCLSPERKIPLLTMFGRNTLWIFILHRPLTLILSDCIAKLSVGWINVISVAATIAICLLLGNNLTAKLMNRFLDGCTAIFISDEKKKINFSQLVMLGVGLFFVVNVILTSYSGFSFDDTQNGKNPDNEISSEEDMIYPVMDKTQEERFDNAFRITFSGDLILLEDQVKRAYNGKDYDFTDVFEYAEPYISSADYAIGVFEGPMAGEDAGYTSSNFDDDKELYLNFPDSFASAVKNAGFDLVTTANNHVLDKGEKAAQRTLDILDSSGLDHTGTYSNETDKNNKHIKIVECQGIKMAVLSYTYGSNSIDDHKLIDGDLSYLTSIVCGTEGEQFEFLKSRVEQDFKEAKALSPDIIIVLPHLGTQFSNKADQEQKVWFDIFKENGADIILGDHPHVVEPAFVEEYNGRNVFTAYCPGNFANIYRKNQGDTSMLIDVYIDRDNKQIIGGSIVPLYTHARADGNFRAVPIYEMMNNDKLRAQLTTDDLELAAKSNNIITNVVFGHEMDITSVTKRYYFNQDGFIRSKTTGIELTDEMKSGLLYSEIKRAKSVCFVGDSVTEGTKNGGCPWYEPIEEVFPSVEFSNYSKGGCTVSYMLEKTDEIPDAELYVIALGTNDVRYRDEKTCAMTAEDYVTRMTELMNALSDKPSFSKVILIAPWYSTDGDAVSKLSFSKKTQLNDEYSLALKNYCKEHSVGFIDANGEIKAVLSKSPNRKFLLDHIHPNSTRGVIMYSEAVLKGR